LYFVIFHKEIEERIEEKLDLPSIFLSNKWVAVAEKKIEISGTILEDEVSFEGLASLGLDFSCRHQGDNHLGCISNKSQAKKFNCKPRGNFT